MRLKKNMTMCTVKIVMIKAATTIRNNNNSNKNGKYGQSPRSTSRQYENDIDLMKQYAMSRVTLVDSED